MFSQIFQRARARLSVEVLEDRTVPTTITASQKQAILDGVNGVARFGDALARYGAFASNIPGLGESAGQAIQIQQTLNTKLVEPVQGYFAGDRTPTYEELARDLDLLPQTIGPVRLTVANDVARFDFTSEVSRTFEKALDVAGVAGNSNSFRLDASAQASVTAGLKFTLALGVPLTSSLSRSHGPVFLYADGTRFDGTVSVSATGINAGVTSNTVPGSARVKDGTAHVNVAAGVTLRDPSREGRITLTELRRTPLTSLTRVTPTGDLEANLPLQITLAGFTTSESDPPTIKVTDANLFAAPAPKVEFLNLPDLTSFELRDAQQFIDGVGRGLSALQNALNSEALGKAYPVVGTKLQEAGQFLERVRTEVLPDLRTRMSGEHLIGKAQQGIYDALGPTGLNLLSLDPKFHDSDGNPNTTDFRADYRDVVYQVSPKGVQFNLVLKQELKATNVPVTLDTSLASLGLDLDARVNLKFGWEATLKFGVSLSDGFYIDTSTKDELKVHFDATFAGSAVGHLGFFQIDASTLSTGLNGFKGTFNVDLKDPNSDGKLTWAELTSGSLRTNQVVSAKLNAQAGIHVNLTTTVPSNGAMPRLLSEFHLDWRFGLTDSTLRGGKPVVSFRNVQLDLGSFLTKFVKPALSNVTKLLDPVKPVVDFLQQPLPLITELAERPYTFVDLAEEFGLAEARGFLDAFNLVYDVSRAVPATPGNVMLQLGDFNLGATDVRSVSSLANVTPRRTRTTTSILSQLSAAGSTGSVAKRLNVTNRFKLEVPLLQDGGWQQAFRLLLGQNVDLIKFDMTALRLSFDYTQFFPIFGPLGATVTGRLEATVRFVFGYDSSGMQAYRTSRNTRDLLNGFYVVANNQANVVVAGSLIPGGVLELVAASGGVEGELKANVNLRLNDPNSDGRLRLNEMGSIIDSNPLGLFSASGKVTVRLYAWYEVLGKRREFNLLDPAVLLTFE